MALGGGADKDEERGAPTASSSAAITDANEQEGDDVDGCYGKNMFIYLVPIHQINVHVMLIG
jgi:hypothetical protein